MTIVYIIIAIVVFFLSMQFFMIIKMRLRKGKPAPELSGKAGRMVQQGERVLFYFYSPSCRACRAMTPIVEKMAKKNKNVVKVDVSRDVATARKFGVMGTPSTVLVESGTIKEFLVGAQPEARLMSLLQKA